MTSHVWIAQSTTSVLILVSYLFVPRAQCSEMNLLDRNALKHHLNNVPLHQITRRQASNEMPTAQDLAYCDSIANDAYCSSGFGQGSADTYLNCGESIEVVRSVHAQCARSENGAFCGSLFSLHDVSRQYLEGNCSGVIASNICPQQCRTHLEDFKRKFGCCINAHLNGTYYYSSVNYRLWNLCGVLLPAIDCENHGLTFTVPASAQNCTTEELVNLQFATLCAPNVAQPYINSLLKDNRCSQIQLNSTKVLINMCSMNPRGEFCFLRIYEGGSTSIYSDYISTLNSNCDYEIGNATDEQEFECRSMCRNKLVEVKNALGCCVNYYNRSTSYSYIPPSSLAYRVWEACGVETPGFCESKLSLNGAASTTYAVQWAFTLATFAMLSTFNFGM